MADRTVPFFHCPETHHLIDTIASLDPLTVYAGAGATIDKSGISWGGLIEGLLEPHIKNAQARRQLVQNQQPLQAASIACWMYRNIHRQSIDPGDPAAIGEVDGHMLSPDLQDPFWRQRLNDRLRVLLYGNGDAWGGGRLVENITTYLLVRLRIGYSSALVTPNYDDYMVEELERSLRLANLKGSQPLRFEVRRPRWAFGNKRSAGVSVTSSSLPYYLLHGYVPRDNADPNAFRPIVCEQDYASSRDESELVLKELLSRSHLLIVGASLTDPPLLRALLDTRGCGYQRYALLPLQGEEWNDYCADSGGLARLRDVRARYDHFEVTPIHPDFFIQVGQFVQELIVCFRAQRKLKGDGEVIPRPYGDPNSTIRYGSRLVLWWNRWYAQGVGPERQISHHKVLSGALRQVRQVLGVPADEQLKIELWLRWAPQAQRKLCLWVSTLAPWSELGAMREDDICRNSPYVSVAAFCGGSAKFSSATDGRWRSYLTIPLWWHSDACMPIPVAVMTLASTKDSSQGSVSEKRRGDLMELLPLIRQAGMYVLNDCAQDDKKDVAPVESSLR